MHFKLIPAWKLNNLNELKFKKKKEKKKITYKIPNPFFRTKHVNSASIVILY